MSDAGIGDDLSIFDWYHHMFFGVGYAADAIRDEIVAAIVGRYPSATVSRVCARGTPTFATLLADEPGASPMVVSSWAVVFDCTSAVEGVADNDELTGVVTLGFLHVDRVGSHDVVRRFRPGSDRVDRGGAGARRVGLSAWLRRVHDEPDQRARGGGGR